MNKIIEICLILVLTAACRQSDETGDEFDYPVCIDMDNRMGELNGFTADTYLLLDADGFTADTYLLLDAENRVVLTGNPIADERTNLPPYRVKR